MCCGIFDRGAINNIIFFLKKGPKKQLKQLKHTYKNFVVDVHYINEEKTITEILLHLSRRFCVCMRVVCVCLFLSAYEILFLRFIIFPFYHTLKKKKVL